MKRIAITIIASLLLILGTQVSAHAYQSEQLGLLSAIGIIDLDEFPEEDETVTRSEFAVIAAKFMGASDTAGVSDGSLVDVTEYTEGNGAIYYLKNIGIMTGDGNGNFNPDDNITQKQATIVLTRALGYGALPDSEESYANSLGIGQMGNSDLTYAELINTVFNALHAECVVTEYKNGAPTYVKVDNYLSEKFAVYKERGVVQSNSITSLDGAKPSSKDTATIGGVVYNCEEFDIDSLLGYNVVCYYLSQNSNKNESGMNKLVYAYSSSVNKVTVVDAKDIYSFDGKTLEYGDRNKKIQIDGDADIIYNGIACPDYNNTMLTPDSGSVTYIENGSDYNVIIIEEYINDIVVSADSEYIYLKQSPKIKLEDYKDEKIRIYDAEGVERTASEIPANSVLSMMYSRDNAVLKLIYSTTMLNGVSVNNRTDDSVMIDEKEYHVNRAYTNWHDIVIEMGDTTYKVYVDYNGEIARFERVVQGENFGYLINTYTDDSGEGRLIKMVPAFGEADLFMCNEKIVIDGKKVPISQLEQKLMTSEGSVAQLVCYELDDNGNIKSIKTAKNKNTFSNSKDDFEINDFRILAKSNPTLAERYRTSTKSFGSLMMLSDSVAVFFIPSATDTEATSDDYWSRGISIFLDDITYSNLIGYTTRAGAQNAEAVVVSGAPKTSSIGNAHRLGVVVDKEEVINEDDEIRTRVTFLIENKRIAFNLDPDLGKVPNKGDAVRFSVNKRDYEIDALNIYCYRDKVNSKFVFQYGISNNYCSSPDVGGSTVRFVSGSVYSMEGNILCLAKGDVNGIDTDNLQFEYYRGVQSAPIYVVDGDFVYIGSSDDLVSYVNDSTEYSRVIINTRYSTVRETIIYKR